MFVVEVITFTHYKGGTGKTTSCISIAGYLAKAGNKVLIIDADPQSNVLHALDIDREQAEPYSIISNPSNADKYIMESKVENISVLPAMMRSAEYKTERLPKNWYDSIKKAAEKVGEDFDYILIDTPPSYSTIIISSAIAADYLILCLDTGVFALQGIQLVEYALDHVEQSTGKRPEIRYNIINKAKKFLMFSDKYTKMSEEVVSKFYDQQKYFIIPFSNKILEAQQHGLPISHYRSSSAGSVYKKLADEIMSTKDQPIEENTEDETESKDTDESKIRGSAKSKDLVSNSNEEIFVD